MTSTSADARDAPGDRFVSERIQPLDAEFDTRHMAVGGVGLPMRFRWRDVTVLVSSVLRTWNETAPCRNGSAERYVRKHWFEVATETHGTMRIYFERQPRRRQLFTRWWLFSILADQSTKLTQRAGADGKSQ